MSRDLQKSRTWFMTRSSCDISGLKVSHPDVFISRYPRSNYLAELAKLGECILLLKEYGYLTPPDLADILQHIEKYIRKNYDKPNGICFVIDIQHLEGADSEARKGYIEYLKSSELVNGMIFYNLSTLFKFNYKLTKRLHLQHDLLHAVATYRQAVDLALTLTAPKTSVPKLQGSDFFIPQSRPKHPDSKSAPADTLVSELKLLAFNLVNRLNGIAIQYYVNELLRHIQSINWHEEGYATPESGIYKHPGFRKIVDALGFIKSDIDTLLNERAEAERKLRERETRFRQLVEHAKAGILEYDYPANRILHINDYFLQIIEYSKDEILSMNPLELFTDESRTLFMQRLKRLTAGEKISQDMEYRIRTRSGTYKWVLFNTYILYENDMPQRANVVVTDISKFKSQQESPPDHPVIDESGERA